MYYDKEFSFGKIRILRNTNYSEKPTIIFLHDSLGCIELWRDFPEKLLEMTQCNILVYDRVGYGKSSNFSNPKRNNDYLEIEADNLNEIITKLSIEKTILFGHSDGGSISLITGAKYPSQIIGIITEGAHIFVEDETLEGINKSIDIYNRTDLRKKLEKYHGDKTEEMFFAWTNTWTSQEYKDWNIEEFLPLIKCPVLVIQGVDDEYGTEKQVKGIVNQVSGISKELLIPDTKHTPHKEKPEFVLEKTAEFINSII